MTFQLRRILPPAAEPVPLIDMKAYLKIDTDTEDSLVSDLIAAARGWVERATGRSLISQTWHLLFDSWPSGATIHLPRPPLQSVSFINVYDSEGVPHGLLADSYTVDINEDRPRIVFDSPGGRPQPGLKTNGIEIEFLAGYGDLSTDIPEPLSQAVKLLAAHWYEHREPADGFAVHAAPHGIEAVVGLYRSVSL